MADLLILALTVFTFQNNTKIAINIYLLEIFALFLVFSYQFTAKCLSLPPPLLGGAISKPLTLPFVLAFRTSNIETVIQRYQILEMEGRSPLPPPCLLCLLVHFFVARLVM